MKNKKKGIFTGTGSVFSFTAKQSMKEKGFKFSTFGIAVFLFAALVLFLTIMAGFQKSDGKTEDEFELDSLQSELEASASIDGVVLYNETDFDKEFLTKFFSLLPNMQVTIDEIDFNPEEDTKKFHEYCMDKFETPIGMTITEKDEVLVFEYYLFEETGVEHSVTESLFASFEAYYEQMRYSTANLPEAEIQVLGMPDWYSVSSADEDELKFGVMIAQMLIPAVFSLLLFSMTVLHGQSITKIVMAEKTSKLVEVLLTSVKPYALIAGKITAMATLAVAQMVIWGVAVVGGYIAGDKIACKIYPEYENIINMVIDMIQKDGTGFSASAVVLAVLFVLIGFLMYCVWAGLIASLVTKAEDLSTAVTIFQIPILIGFMISYMGSLLQMNTLLKVSAYLPIVSPFVMPADLLVGRAGIPEGILSLALLSVFTFIFILFTGKMYKKRIL